MVVAVSSHKIECGQLLNVRDATTRLFTPDPLDAVSLGEIGNL